MDFVEEPGATGPSLNAFFQCDPIGLRRAGQRMQVCDAGVICSLRLRVQEGANNRLLDLAVSQRGQWILRFAGEAELTLQNCYPILWRAIHLVYPSHSGQVSQRRREFLITRFRQQD